MSPPTSALVRNFDRGVRDIFDIQDEVSRAIVRALQLTLRVEHQARLVSRATRDIEAYTLYLQSLSAQPRDAIEYLEAATQRDPNFAPAYVKLAENWSRLAQWGRGSTGGVCEGPRSGPPGHLPRQHPLGGPCGAGQGHGRSRLGMDESGGGLPAGARAQSE